MPTFEELRTKYAQAEQDFDIPLSGGEVLKARTLTDATAMVALEKHAGVLHAMLSEAPTAEYAPYRGTAFEIVLLAVMMEALLVEPKVTVLDALDMAKHCGLLFTEISTALDRRAAGHAAKAAADAIEQEKKD